MRFLSFELNNRAFGTFPRQGIKEKEIHWPKEKPEETTTPKQQKQSAESDQAIFLPYMPKLLFTLCLGLGAPRHS